MRIQLVCLLVATVISTVAATSSGDVMNMPTGLTSLQFLAVGDAGNVPDTTGLGAVGYVYQIGTYDVTTSQYAAFLTAVASNSDPYGLYYSGMANGQAACGIVRTGISGGYSYSVVAGHENFPVNNISWGEAARFCNWLQNGQPVGTEGSGTTETGAYTLNGKTANSDLLTVTRNTDAVFFLPSANEWYKAAYYKGGGTNTGYWLYPTRSNAAPSNVLSATGTNNANYNLTDPINYLTPVGAFGASPGPYGTFDQGGLLYQWTDTLLTTTYSGFEMFNSSFLSASSNQLESNYTVYPWSPVDQYNFQGFRVAEVPEPATLGLLAVGAIGLVRRRRKAPE